MWPQAPGALRAPGEALPAWEAGSAADQPAGFAF